MLDIKNSVGENPLKFVQTEWTLRFWCFIYLHHSWTLQLHVWLVVWYFWWCPFTITAGQAIWLHWEEVCDSFLLPFGLHIRLPNWCVNQLVLPDGKYYLGLAFLKCTHVNFAEITAFSDRHEEFEKINTEILGVSVDSVVCFSPGQLSMYPSIWTHSCSLETSCVALTCIKYIIWKLVVKCSIICVNEYVFLLHVKIELGHVWSIRVNIAVVQCWSFVISLGCTYAT